uniref:Heat shock protein 70 n=2 Tax=Panagrolaimus sp. PS1159 TaxID=55785 RepID=A0AC35GVF7_9BILA
MTRCCVAVNRSNGIVLVAIDGSERQLPSYVSFKEKDPICGQLVLNQLEFYANASVFDIKRIIGRNFDEIQIHSSWPFEVIKNDMDKPLIQVLSCEGSITIHPEEVTAILLKHVKQKIEEFQGKEMDEVVITIPVAFNMDQKIATHVAADLAGFKTVHLLEEPIAASIAYFVDRPIPSAFNMLLFDLGGGTLDLCIFKVEKKKFKVIVNNGDSNLGGKDFDTVLFQHFEKILETKYKITMNEKNRYRLMQKCVEIKHTLSIENETSLDVGEFNPKIDELLKMKRQELQKMIKSKKSFDIEDYKIDEFLRITRHEFEQIYVGEFNPKIEEFLKMKRQDLQKTVESKKSIDIEDFKIDEFLRITRHEFEQMCVPVLNRIQEVFIQIFSKTELTPIDINKVLLVGGGCRMPMIQLFLRNSFPKAEHSCGKNPDEMVAIGAAYFSSFLILDGPQKKVVKNNSSNCNIM